MANTGERASWRNHIVVPTFPKIEEFGKKKNHTHHIQTKKNDFA